MTISGKKDQAWETVFHLARPPQLRDCFAVINVSRPIFLGLGILTEGPCLSTCESDFIQTHSVMQPVLRGYKYWKYCPSTIV